MLGDWTKKLQEVAKTKQEVEVWLHGPYGMPGVDLNNEEYTVFGLISGGVGITPMHSISNELVHQHLHGRPLNKIFFLTSFRHPSLIQAIL